MRNYLKTYEITLTTKGPVYIGSGKAFGKKEYVFLPENEVGIVDISKLYSTIQKKGLAQQFEAYMLSGDKQPLNEWLEINEVPIEEIETAMKYRVRYGKLSEEEGKRLEIREFVKDPYGNPYIPGTSLKGMLRTILLAADMVGNAGKYQGDKKKMKKELTISQLPKKFTARSMRETEAKRFNLLERNDKKTNAVNDILSGMIVSDSEPLHIRDLVLCQRVERGVNGSEKKLNVLRECIKPGCSIRFRLTIDESICNIKAQTILSAVQTFADMYNACFVCKFNGMDLLDDNMVCLGGGVGFLSKTVIYPLFGEKEGFVSRRKYFRKQRCHVSISIVRMLISESHHILSSVRNITEKRCRWVSVR